MSIRQLVVISSVLAASWVAARPVADGPWKALLPDSEFAKLVTLDSKLVQENLSKGLDEKRYANGARRSAMMIAGYAQSSMMARGSNAAQLAGLRDHALKLSKAIDERNLAEAKKLAAEVSPTFAGAPGKAEPVDLNKPFDLGELMHQFKPERSGGKDLEKKIKTYMQKRAALTSEEVKDAVVTAYQTAIIAQFTFGFGPKVDQGKKKKADWATWTTEMGDLALAAAKVSSTTKPDDKAVKAAFKKLDDACTRCHAVFKED